MTTSRSILSPRLRRRRGDHLRNAFLKREAEHDGAVHISRMIATSQRCRTRHAQAQARLSGVILDVFSLDGAREADLVVVEAVEFLGSWPQSSGPPVALCLRAERGL
jgi:hypothetical protein